MGTPPKLSDDPGLNEAIWVLSLILAEIANAERTIKNTCTQLDHLDDEAEVDFDDENV